MEDSQNNPSTNPAEALLKIADESLANIDNELNQSRKGSKQSRASNNENSVDSRKGNGKLLKPTMKDI